MSRSAAAVKRCLFPTSICGSFLCTPGVLPMKAKYVMLPRLSPNRARSKTVLTFPWSIFATCPFRPVCERNGRFVAVYKHRLLFAATAASTAEFTQAKKDDDLWKKGVFPSPILSLFVVPTFGDNK